MKLKAHLSDIHKVIIDHLRTAQSDIVAAVAWFTDCEIFDVRCKKAGSGVKVTIAVIGDDINKGPGVLIFHRLAVVDRPGKFSVGGQTRHANVAQQVLHHRPQHQ